MSTYYIFLWRNKKKSQYVLVEKVPYLELCFTFNINIKIAQLKRQLLGSTKGSLNSRILLG